MTPLSFVSKKPWAKFRLEALSMAILICISILSLIYFVLHGSINNNDNFFIGSILLIISIPIFIALFIPIMGEWVIASRIKSGPSIYHEGNLFVFPILGDIAVDSNEVDFFSSSHNGKHDVLMVNYKKTERPPLTVIWKFQEPSAKLVADKANRILNET